MVDAGRDMTYNPYKKYSSSWWRFWLNLPSDIFAFINRILDYTPLLWEDRDWDHADLLRMIRFKIRRMRKHMEKHAIIAHAEDHVTEMAQADVLLRNIIEEDPDDEWSAHYYQWDAHKKSFRDCKNPQEHTRALMLSQVRTERNWQQLWRHFDKYMRGWWD